MSTNDFDKLFKERFEEQEFAFNQMNWEKLSRELPKERSRRQLLPWLTGVAASVALVAGVVWFFRNNTTDTADNTPIAKVKTEMPAPHNSVATDPRPADDTNILQKVVPVSNNMLVSTKNVRKSVSDINKENNAINPGDDNTPDTKPYDKNLLPFTPDPVSKPNEQIVTKGDPQPTPTRTFTNEDLKDPIFFTPDENTSSKERRLAVSLAGGVNYGSFNTGYGASVNARQKIGKKLFVEGDLGFMQNQELIASAMSTEQFDVMNSGQFRGRPAKLEEKPYNIYYLQMAPSIGYQIHKNVSVGVGADVQKLLDGRNDDRPVVTTEQGFKLIPLWDAGVTGKTEYTISNRIKAGVLYREGVNNLLQGNNNYYERRYLQIQMKLRLFGK